MTNFLTALAKTNVNEFGNSFWQKHPLTKLGTSFGKNIQ